jgi:DNA-binding CsgD family transcriptional regulator
VKHVSQTREPSTASGLQCQNAIMHEERQVLEEMFLSALLRLPNPVFSFDSERMLRPLNRAARKTAEAEQLVPELFRSAPSHPLSLVLKQSLNGNGEGATTHRLSFPNGGTYEVEISARSPRGAGRILLVVLRDASERQEAAEESLFAEWQLTEREREIVRAVSSGLTSEEICEQLSVSRNTLKTHLLHVFEKSGTRSRTELLARLRASPVKGR